MSSVGPSDGGYQYYQRNINELEDELRQEHKRAQERVEGRIRHVEEAAARDVAAKEVQSEETVRVAKERAQEAISQNNEQNKAELAKMKAASYDKFGRYNGEEASVLQQELSSTADAAEKQHANDMRAMSDTEEAYKARITELNKEHDQDLADKTQAAHDSAAEAYSRMNKDQKDSYEADQKALKDHYDDLYKRAMSDVAFERRRAEHAGDDMKRDFDHRYKKLEDSSNKEMGEQLEESRMRAVKAAEELRASHSEESKTIRDQLKDLLEAEKTYTKEIGQGTQDAIRDYENEWRTRQTAMSGSYEKEIQALKDKAQQEDAYFAALNNRTLKEKDAYYSKVINKQNQDNVSEKRDLAETFQRAQEAADKRLVKERQTASAYLEKRVADENEHRESTLKEQSMAFQGTLERQRSNDQAEIKALQKALVQSRTSEDTSVISPAAEEKVRRSIISEYEKTGAADKERKERNIASIQQSYADRTVDTANEKDAYITKLQQTSEGERQRERSELLNNLQEAEIMKNTTLKNQELDHGRETEQLIKHYTQAMNEQRRRYEEIIANFQNESQNKLQSTRLENEFNSKMAQRAGSAHESELIRDYEKKISDQKSDYEALLHDAKEYADSTVREGNRQNKQQLEEQARMYEQKLAQTEYQHKERERYMEKNFQEDLDKTKRANALLLQKKS